MPQKSWRRGNKARKGFDEVDNVVEKSWEFMERQNVRPLTELNSRCICERSMTPLLCTSCKKTYYGRIGRTCTEHPNVIIWQASVDFDWRLISSISGALLARFASVLQLQLEDAHRNRRKDPHQHESDETLTNCAGAPVDWTTWWPSDLIIIDIHQIHIPNIFFQS